MPIYSGVPIIGRCNRGFCISCPELVVTMRKVDLRRKLNTFDVTSLVVGSIIGADIYVAAAIGARLVGPSSLLVWVAAGAIAIVIALSFSHCAMLMPRVGGPYAYVREVSDSFTGFTVGWALFLAEWFSLAVFPVAFVQYSSSMVNGTGETTSIALKGGFILIVFVTNLVGIKAAGKFNDVLTISKLAPLLLLTVAGLTYIAFNADHAVSNFTPFFTGKATDIGQALVLIFWAYAGFELATLPANEIERPERTIPRAIVTGMIIVMIFYLVTNFVILGTVDQSSLSSSQTPLMDASSTMFVQYRSLSLAVPVIIGIGAIVSILGADESGTIGTSRLAYAMSVDGLFPKLFSTIHPRYRTPYLGLAIICLTAFIASVLGALTELISASVFLLAFAYFSTAAATIRLGKKYPEAASKLRGRLVIPIAGMFFSVVLMALVDFRLILVSFALIVAGLPVYVVFAPKKEVHELREAFLSREAVLRRTYEQGERFLAYPWRRVMWLVYRRRRMKRPWIVQGPARPDK